MKEFSRLLFAFTILIALSACVSTATPQSPAVAPTSQSVPTAATGGQTAAAPAVIKIGALFPLTGAVAATGQASRDAVLLAVDIINGQYPDLNMPLAATAGLPHLGGAKIQVVFADPQMDPQKGASETERLITQEKVVAIQGAYASAVTETSSQVAERLGIPEVNDQSTSPTLTTRGFKWFFRTTPNDAMFSELMFKFLTDMNQKKNANIKNVMTIHENTLFGTGSSTTQTQFAQKYGFPVIGDVAYTAGTADMTSEVQKLVVAKPDVVLPTSYIADAILMLKTFKDQDYMPNAILAQGVGFTEGTFLPSVGKDANCILSREVFSLDLATSNPLITKVNDLFKSKYNRTLEGATARSFTAMIVLADAIDRAGSTQPEAIRQALINTNIPGDQLIMPWQGVKFDQTGQNTLGSGIIVQAFDGEYHVVWPFESATKSVVYPCVPWSKR